MVFLIVFLEVMITPTGAAVNIIMSTVMKDTVHTIITKIFAALLKTKISSFLAELIYNFPFKDDKIGASLFCVT